MRRGPTAPDRTPARRLLVAAGTAAVLALTLAAGWWGLRADRGAEPHGHPAAGGQAWTAVPGGGWLRVTEVTDRSITHQRMPGMQTMPDPDPVPDGMVRLHVGVELAAEGRDLTWRAADFALVGTGLEAVAPHDTELGDGVVPVASQVAGGLVFDVPETATGLALRFRDAEAVPLEVPRAVDDTPGRDHGPDDEHGHDDSEPDDHPH